MRPVWLEQSERGGEREEERPGRGQGRSCRAGGRIWIFTPRRSVGRGGLGPDSDAHEHPLRSWYIYTMEYYSANKKIHLNPF